MNYFTRKIPCFSCVYHGLFRIFALVKFDNAKLKRFQTFTNSKVTSF